MVALNEKKQDNGTAVKRAKSVPILWKYNFYLPTFLDNSRSPQTMKETGDWSGVLFVRKYKVKQYKCGPRLLKDTDIVEFGGIDYQSMLNSLVEKIEGLSELYFSDNRRSIAHKLWARKQSFRALPEKIKEQIYADLKEQYKKSI